MESERPDIEIDEERAAAAALAARAVQRWPAFANARVTLINVAENLTFLVEGVAGEAVLRLHREGYHDRLAVESELAWSQALARDGGVETPAPLPGADGEPVQEVEGRRFVMFEFVDGSEPTAEDDLARPFEELGRIAARAHLHAVSWVRPPWFKRLIWDDAAVLGPAPTWGSWAEGPNVGPAERAVLGAAAERIAARLSAYGRGPERYGLIHADMRLANILIHDGRPRLIDFDDCGFGWFMYDFAAAISFIEDDPQIPAMKRAWLKGYKTTRALTAVDEAEIDTLVMLRRLALLGWIGSRIEAPEPQALAPDFARVSAELAEIWLSSKA